MSEGVVGPDCKIVGLGGDGGVKLGESGELLNWTILTDRAKRTRVLLTMLPQFRNPVREFLVYHGRPDALPGCLDQRVLSCQLSCQVWCSDRKFPPPSGSVLLGSSTFALDTIIF